jgi:hypothetical protein
MNDYIDLEQPNDSVQPDDTELIDLSKICKNVPFRIITEYEISSTIKDISKKDENKSTENLPR